MRRVEERGLEKGRGERFGEGLRREVWRRVEEGGLEKG